MKSIVVYPAIARLGNSMFQFAAAYAYSLDHGLDFSPPSQTLDEKWRALYFKHLINPNIESPDLKRVEIKERGYRYQPLEFRPEWAEDHLIVIDGFRQSTRYFSHHLERVLAAFNFPWNNDREGVVAVHVRRSDALKFPEKHIILTKEYYEAQMAKFKGHRGFHFFSDDIEWCVENFSDRTDCFFRLPFKYYDVGDDRVEVQDLVAASNCGHLIGSASTFAVWIGLLNRNPNKRCIFPNQWLVEGWQGTTAADWADVVPVGPGWERA